MEDYEQSQKPPYSPASSGDNVSYQATSSRATSVGSPAIGKGFWFAKKSDTQTLTTYTVQICVNGVPKSLDVYVAGNPY
jgi:hypothetical protein